MAVPKRKTSKSRKNMRRSHDSIEGINYTFDKISGNPKLPHHIDLSDGTYNGRQVFTPKSMRVKPEEADSETNTENSAQA